MDLSQLTITPEDFNANFIRRVIETTAPAQETPAAMRVRAASIVAMFQAFEPGNAIEAVFACNCIAMEFLLMDAMADANNPNAEAGAATKARATAVTISKTLHLWVTKLETTKARNEARAAEAARQADHPGEPRHAAPAKPVQARREVPPAQGPQAPLPQVPLPHAQILHAVPASPPVAGAGLAVAPGTDRMLAAAVPQTARPNGASNGAAPHAR